MMSLRRLKPMCFAVSALLCVSIFTGCSQTASKFIDTVPSSVTLENAAETLGCSSDDLQAYLDYVDMSWDEFRAQLNAAQMTVAEFKENAEESCPEGADFADYLQFNLFEADETQIAEISDSYTLLESEHGSYDVYVETAELSDKGFTDIKNSEIITDADSEYNHVFMAFSQYGTGIELLTTVLNEVLNKDNEYRIGVEIMPVIILSCDSGRTLPDYADENPFFDDGYIYAYGEQDKLMETTVCSAVTVHYYDDDNVDINTRSEDAAAKDFALLCSADFGFIIKADDYLSLTKIADIPMQVRFNDEKVPEFTESEIEQETAEATEAEM